MGDRAKHLGLNLPAHAGEFTELLLAQDFCDIPLEDRVWLRQRYERIVPLVLVDALHSVETGEPLPGSCLHALKVAAAESAQDTSVRLSVVLRAGLPALRIFTEFVRAARLTDPQRAVIAMARAARVAHELGACWTEAWNEACRDGGGASAAAVAGADTSAIDVVVASPDLDGTEERMLELTAQGMSNEAIAEATSYSRQAVGWHLARIMRVWKAPNRTALVALAFVKGAIVARTAPRSPLQIESVDQAGTRKSSAQETSS